MPHQTPQHRGRRVLAQGEEDCVYAAIGDRQLVAQRHGPDRGDHDGYQGGERRCIGQGSGPWSRSMEDRAGEACSAVALAGDGRSSIACVPYGYPPHSVRVSEQVGEGGSASWQKQ